MRSVRLTRELLLAAKIALRLFVVRFRLGAYAKLRFGVASCMEAWFVQLSRQRHRRSTKKKHFSY